MKFFPTVKEQTPLLHILYTFYFSKSRATEVLTCHFGKKGQQGGPQTPVYFPLSDNQQRADQDVGVQ